MKNLQYVTLVFMLTLFISSCGNMEPKEAGIFLGNYKRDKFIASDTAEFYRNAIDQSGDWTISLRKKNEFTFRGTKNPINGIWSIDEKENEDYSIIFTYQKDTVKARLKGNIIYFDAPNMLLENIFEKVIFVKTAGDSE